MIGRRATAGLLVVMAALSVTGTAHADDSNVRRARIDTTVRVAGKIVDVDKPRGTLVATLDWRRSDRKRTLRPCRNEDSPNCFWDARNMGDGVGRSFVDLGGRVYYWRNQ